MLVCGATSALAALSWALERFSRLDPLGGAGGASASDRQLASDAASEQREGEGAAMETAS